nr:unnamed protein product [Callosobruchus analis]
MEPPVVNVEQMKLPNSKELLVGNAYIPPNSAAEKYEDFCTSVLTILESYAQLQQWFDESSDDGAIESGSDFENEMDVVTYSEHDTNSEQEGESDSDDSLDNSTSDDTKNIYFLQILSSTFRDQEESQSKLDQKRNVLSCF